MRLEPGKPVTFQHGVIDHQGDNEEAYELEQRACWNFGPVATPTAPAAVARLAETA
jgi:hypothetical protein